jgi:endonuclease YncB( thermonuclease family)
MRVLPPQIHLLTVFGICLITTACLAAPPPAATPFPFTDATERFKGLAGETVRVEFGPRQEDRYGRILYYVYTQD